MSKKISNFGINFYSLNKKEFDTLISKTDTHIIDSLSEKSSNYYIKRVALLGPGRVLFDYQGLLYEFENMHDYFAFEAAINKVLAKEASYLYLEDIDGFIENYDKFKDDVKTKFGILSYDYDHLKGIKKVFISSNDKKTLVLIFCEIILANVKNSYLKVLSLGGNKQIIVVSVLNTFYSPADILMRQKDNEKTWGYIEYIISPASSSR